MKLNPTLLVAGLALVGGCSDDRLTVKEPIDTKAGEISPAESARADQAATAKINKAAKAVYFGFDASTLDGPAQAALAQIAYVLKDNPALNFTIEGHADERGSTEYNLALGEKRAHAVKTYLVNLGIDEKHLRTVSYGEEQPVAQGHNEEAWSKNRRAAFVKAYAPFAH